MNYDELAKEIMTIKSIEDSDKKVLNSVLKVALGSLVKGTKLEKTDGEYSIVGL
ncbi:hypothetical protein [Yersinia rohdei]|uniref:hypothetical protein n=1 Tax=Yersinia rohdei TaxID=29485 RepID=UPI001643C2B6|nr:hypothetical protein [Yersinia rohdei]